MKKIISLLTALIMFASVCTVSAPAFADDIKEVFLGENYCENIYHPGYANEEGERESYCTAVPYRFKVTRSGIYYFSVPVKFAELKNFPCLNTYQGKIHDDYYLKARYIYLTEGTSIDLYYVLSDPENEGYARYYTLIIEYITEAFETDEFFVDVPNNEVKLKAPLKEIPSQVLTIPLAVICEYAYYNCYNLTEITIPASVEYIEDYAFVNCTKLKKAVFESDKTVYGENAFFNCRKDLEIIGGKKSAVNKKKTSFKKLKAGKKQFRATWKAVSGVSGYQLQYSLKKNMKSAKKKTVRGKKKNAVTIKKLKSKKTYYVRIRTYKTIKGKKVFSKWSKIKKVKTK